MPPLEFDFSDPRKAAPGRNALKLCRFADDAWEDGLRAWCAAAAPAALHGVESWLVVAQRGQARWLKRRALQEGLTLFGIRFLEAPMLRRALLTWHGLEAPRIERDVLELLLQGTAAVRAEPEAQAIARSAGAGLRAMDELAAAGWGEAEFDLPPPVAQALFQKLRATGAWTPEIDRALLARARPKPLRSAVVGWDAAHFGELDLLAALAQSSAVCALFLPQPRAVAEDLQQSWIEAVEARLNLSATPCEASGFSSPQEPLVARLEGADLDTAVAAPQLLVGRNWPDQIALVRDDVLTWLAEAPGETRAALIVPRRGPTSVALTRALAEAGVALLDETGEKQEAPFEVLIQAQLARYHLLGRDLEVLLGLLHLLREKNPAAWAEIDPEKLHALFHRAFQTMQSRDARLLACGHEDRSSVWPRLGALIAELGVWEGVRPWSAWRVQWEGTLRALGLGRETLAPRWAQIEPLLGTMPIPARAFLEDVAAALSVRNSERPPEAAEPHARVIITTLANALHQTWDRLVFLDANEGVWPIATEENPFLDDAARRALNSRGRGRLLTTGDLAALEQARFLDLLEHDAGALVFAASARSASEPGCDAFPNEWLLRCLVESHGGDPQPALAAWPRQISQCPRADQKLPAAELAHLQGIHASRQDPAHPFDNYLFNFRETARTATPWAAAQLDEAVTCPATFALRVLFQAEARCKKTWTRAEGGVIGSHVHIWLARALDGTEELRPLVVADAHARLTEAIAETVRHLRECYARLDLPLPIWWESCLRKAARVARRCLAPVLAVDGIWYFAMEKNVREEVVTGEGTLRLKGRYDLLLSDRAELAGAHVRVIDFKTGSAVSPSFTTLAHGSGFQFVAYFLMARAAGAAGVAVGAIRPDEAKLDAFTDVDEVALREAIAPVAKLQRDLNFGRRGPLVAAWGRCEKLPMATLAIPPRVLEAKAALTAW